MKCGGIEIMPLVFPQYRNSSRTWSTEEKSWTSRPLVDTFHMSISRPRDFHVSLFSDRYMHQWPLRFLPPISPLARIDSLFATGERW